MLGYYLDGDTIATNFLTLCEGYLCELYVGGTFDAYYTLLIL